MSQRDAERALRIELLQARAGVERAELDNALHAIGASTRRARSLSATIGGFASSIRGATPSTVFGGLQLLREHPWLLSTAAALLARRPLRRLLLISGIGAAVYLAASFALRQYRSATH